MPFYQSGLNSAAPYTGTKLSDAALDTHKNYHSSDGRLSHTEHNYTNGVVEIVGTKLRIHPSSWLITVKRNTPIDSIQAFQALVQVGYGASIDVSYSGNGSLVGVIKYAKVQSGAITSTDGVQECELRWVPNGHTMTDIQLKNSVAPDFCVRMCDVISGVVVQGKIVENHYYGGIDMHNTSITGVLGVPYNPSAVVVNSQLTPLLNSINTQLVLSVNTNNHAFPYTLTWLGTLITGTYDVLRNNIVIATLSPMTTTYKDYDWISSTVSYQIRQTDSITGIITVSNIVSITPTNSVIMPLLDFGDAAHGTLNSTSGTLNMIRGRVYRYSNINISNTIINLTGNGSTVILVDGNMSLSGSTVINGNITANNQLTNGGYGVINYSLLGTKGVHGNGGSGANSPSGVGIGGTGGSGSIETATSNSNAFGGLNGWGNTYGQAGHTAGNNGLYAAGGGGGGARDSAAYGGLGGVGGVLSGLQPSLIFIIKGSLTITSSVVFNGVGANGGIGSIGSIGGYNPVGARWGGSGGGGGGAAGASGMRVYMLVQGAQSISNFSTNLASGAGGAGGVSTPYPGNPGTAGASGTSGTAGSSGFVQITAI